MKTKSLLIFLGICVGVISSFYLNPIERLRVLLVPRFYENTVINFPDDPDAITEWYED